MGRAGVVTLLAVALGAAAPESQVGRFQIIPATVVLVTEKAVVEKKEVFLLDTSNGRSWCFLRVLKDSEGLVVGDYWTEANGFTPNKR